MKRSDSPIDSTIRWYSAASGECSTNDEVPVLGVVQVGEAAVDQGADEVEGERRALVAAQQAVGIGGARLRRERRAVDEVAAVGGQRHARRASRRRRSAAWRTGRRCARRGSPALARPCTSTRLICSRILSLAAIDVGAALVEALGAVAALEQEALAAGGLGELPLSTSTSHEVTSGGSAASSAERPRQRGRVGVGRLLQGRLGSPGVGGPVGHRLQAQRHAAAAVLLPARGCYTTRRPRLRPAAARARASLAENLESALLTQPAAPPPPG